MSKCLVASFCVAGAELYCPDENSWVNEGASSFENGGWTVQGGGGVTGKTSFNLLGGYVEFDVDNGGSQWGVNNNFYTISPDHPYTERNDYCDGQGPEASSPLGIYCMELDIYEANGGQNLATTWHTWFNKNGGCDMGGCGAMMDMGGQFHVKAQFDDNGWMHVYFNGNEIGGFNPYPSNNARDSVRDTMNSRGVVFSSSQWTGWVPGAGNVDGDLDNSRFSISNVQVSGSVVMGPEPPKCGGGPSPSPTPGLCETSVGKNNDGTNLQSTSINTNSAEDCCSHCSTTSGCAGYTWVHANHECWLKSAVGPTRDDGDVTSGSYSAPTPTPTPTSTPTPGAGICCFGALGCGADADCHADEYCGQSQDHCENNCRQHWCPSGPTPSPPTPPTTTPPTPPRPTPSPTECPGGSLKACVGLCPTSPVSAFTACINVCGEACGVGPSCTGGDDGTNLSTCMSHCPTDSGFSECIQCCAGKFTSVTLV